MAGLSIANDAGRVDAPRPVIVILGMTALPTARRIQKALPGAEIHGFSKRMTGLEIHADVSQRIDRGIDQGIDQSGDRGGEQRIEQHIDQRSDQGGEQGGEQNIEATFDNLAGHLQELYRTGRPIVGLCAAGILIRCLAECIGASAAQAKCVEPPVLAVAANASAVVPLLGGLAGVNAMARIIATALAVTPAITTTGELRFGTCLLDPPEGYALADIDAGKRFVSDLLAGETTRVESAHTVAWLENIDLPRANDATRRIRVSVEAATDASTLLIHPRAIVMAIADIGASDGVSHGRSDNASDDAHRASTASLQADSLVDHVTRALTQRGLARESLAALVLDARHIGSDAVQDAGQRLNVPVRFVSASSRTNGNTDAKARTIVATRAPALDAQRLLETACAQVWPDRRIETTLTNEIALTILETPLQRTESALLGRKRGSLSVVGIGPGDKSLLAPAAKGALAHADDILGYTTYTDMAGPFTANQTVHGTDNREEMQRARHAFALANTGRDVVMVSSGDPGVFAMASAVLEALDEVTHNSTAEDWSAVSLRIIPGISAAMATAAVAGAPLGHDFCILSLSDNLKPWAVIESRLRLAAQADLVIALYNPVSKARPWQLSRALDILRSERDGRCPVLLGRDIGRPGASLRTVSLDDVNSDMVDMRTVVIVGSSTTRQFDTAHGQSWVYTPRWYPTAPER